MPLMPPELLSRQLVWDDFGEVEKPAPKEGEVAKVAWTNVKYGYDAANVKSTPESKHKKYKLVKVPTVTMGLQPDSWVADFVFDWDEKHQDDLLAHEQIHYLISVLAGRDCVNEFKSFDGKEYSSVKEAAAEFNAAFASLDVQKIHVKYDVDTHSLPTDYPTEQSAWTKAINKAHTQNKPMRKTLLDAGLITKEM